MHGPAPAAERRAHVLELHGGRAAAVARRCRRVSCPTTSPWTIPEMRCFDPNRCACLSYGDRYPSHSPWSCMRTRECGDGCRVDPTQRLLLQRGNPLRRPAKGPPNFAGSRSIVLCLPCMLSPPLVAPLRALPLGSHPRHHTYITPRSALQKLTAHSLLQIPVSTNPPRQGHNQNRTRWHGLALPVVSFISLLRMKPFFWDS